MAPLIALTIAGSDPSGGAGLQADLKTFHRFGVYGESVVTLVTVQNTTSVSRVECLDADLVTQQLRAVLSDVPPLAAKTGALGNASIVRAIAEAARGFAFPLVIDPVMISKHGRALLDDDAIEVFRSDLLPCATLLTPNLDEAAKLTGRAVGTVGEMVDAAKALAGLGAKSVLVKGGHLVNDDAVDVLWHEGQVVQLRSPRIETKNTHGAGCTYSAAITAGLARGMGLVEAVREAKDFVDRAIATAPRIGSGNGPLNHFA